MVEQGEILHDRVAILDAPRGLDVQAVKEWRETGLGASSFAALYYPWIEVYDPQADRPMLIPPSGHVAGLESQRRCARRLEGARKRGGRRCSRARAADLRCRAGRPQRHRRDAIWAFRGRGIRIWGARTPGDRRVGLSQCSASVQLRRGVVKDGTALGGLRARRGQLWQRITRTVNAFLIGLWRQGALVGTKPEQAFFVKCDAETNPEDLQDRGIVTIQVRDRARQAGGIRGLQHPAIPQRQRSGKRVRRRLMAPAPGDPVATRNFGIEIDGVNIAQFRDVQGVSTPSPRSRSVRTHRAVSR